MLDSILLEACNPELNIWRSYRITGFEVQWYENVR